MLEVAGGKAARTPTKPKPSQRSSPANSPSGKGVDGAKRGQAASSSGKAAKVFPSQQLRQIVHVEQMYNELVTMTQAVQEAETLLSLPISKVMSAINKLDSKVGKGDSVSKLLAANVMAGPDQSQEDLGARGKAILNKATKLLEQLQALAHLCESLHCEDELALEHSPSYLHMAFVDAAKTGRQLNLRVLAVAVGRAAKGNLRDGNVDGDMALLDPSLDAALGVCLLKASPEQLAAAQSDVACTLVVEMLNQESLKGLDRPLARLLDLVRNENVQVALTHVRHIVNANDHADVSTQHVQVAASCLSLGEEKCPEELAKRFASGRCKELLVEAKRACAQRTVDAGRTG